MAVLDAEGGLFADGKRDAQPRRERGEGFGTLPRGAAHGRTAEGGVEEIIAVDRHIDAKIIGIETRAQVGDHAGELEFVLQIAGGIPGFGFVIGGKSRAPDIG